MPGSPDVRDVLQEVNIVLWEKMGNFKLGTNFGAWACTVAHYKVLDHRKKKAKQDGLLVFNNRLSSAIADEAEPREPEELEAKRTALDECFEKLTPKEQELLAARYDSPTGDMGRVCIETGRTRASLRVSLCRLRATLRRCIEKKLEGEGVAHGS